MISEISFGETGDLIKKYPKMNAQMNAIYSVFLELSIKCVTDKK